MKTLECSREQDLLDALASGRWPSRAPDLEAHVRQCAICADIVTVAVPLLDDRDPEAGARIPSSAVMWWRAQMRARQEAAREATRPIAVAQIVGAIVAVTLAAALSVALFPWLRAGLTGLAGQVASGPIALDVRAILSTGGWLLPALIVGAGLVLTPLAVYLVVLED